MLTRQRCRERAEAGEPPPKTIEDFRVEIPDALPHQMPDAPDGHRTESIDIESMDTEPMDTESMDADSDVIHASYRKQVCRVKQVSVKNEQQKYQGLTEQLLTVVCRRRPSARFVFVRVPCNSFSLRSRSYCTVRTAILLYLYTLCDLLVYHT